MNKYLIYIKANIEIEAEDVDKAKELATEKLKSFEGLNVDEAKVADKATGFFVN